MASAVWNVLWLKRSSSARRSRLICSSKSEYITTAPAPASSSLRMPSTVCDSGDEDATTGFPSVSPMYVVVTSTIPHPSSLFCHLLILLPLRVDRRLRLAEEE